MQKYLKPFIVAVIIVIVGIAGFVLWQKGGSEASLSSGARFIGFPKGNPMPIDQSVVGYWKMDDASGQTTIKDYTANGNDGTSANNKVDATDVWGNSGGAMSFNGSSDYITVTHNTVFNIPDLTVAAWVKCASGGGTYQGAVAKYDAQSYGYMLAPVWGDKALFLYYIGSSTTNQAEKTIDLRDDTWHYLVGTREDSGNISLYIDGTLVDSREDIATGATTNTHDLLISGWRYAGSNLVNGSISDVRIYNRALSANEIYQMYARGRQ